ncbi:MAG: DUF488 domain-containing protein [Candidatus Aenigmarchaeota archaeon]|nr:DUF488 domain-containing protein [Candidatus Aenigmarchaeota archaeon]
MHFVMLKHKLFTIGYEGKNIDEFIEILKKNEIKCLVDVRNNGFSFKKFFCRNLLKNLLEKSGIKFIAVPEVGAPKFLRDELKKTDNINRFFRKYERHIRQNGYLPHLKTHINSERVCLMCFERNAFACHRHILTDMLEEEMPIRAIHI